MKIKELKTDHPRIYELAMLRQKEAGNEANDDVDLGNVTCEGGFSWDKAIEGWDFWNSIYDYDLNVFYRKYPHTNDLPLINPEMLEMKDPINKAWHDKFARPLPTIDPLPTEIKTPEYYDNSNGSLYKLATERNWNPYLFDIVKRLERGGKKDPLKQEIEKSIAVLQLWLKESE